MSDPLFIGIDLGTTNGKVACYDRQGHLLASAMHGYETHFPEPGWYEQNPADWLNALEQGLSEAASILGARRSHVAGLAVSNFGPGLVMVDQDGAPLAPCPTWQDKRCEPQGQRLLDAVGTDWIGLGTPLGAFPAKVLWAIENQPELAAQAVQMLDIKGYLMRWLTGSAATDPSSGPGSGAWYAPAFEAAGWPVERLSRVVRPTSTAGGLRTELARRIGLPSGLPVFAGINDGAAATLGSGVVRLGQSIITLATNGVARLVIQKRLAVSTILNSFMFSWPYIDDLWLCGGFTLSGAGSLQWLADLFGIPRDPEAYDALLAEAADVPPGSRGVVFVPYLLGRGTPHADPDRRGGFVHVGLTHGRAELARAVLEGITFALAEIYGAFAALGFEVQDIRLTGGGARSPLWRQIIADVLKRPVVMAGGDSTLGSAIVTAVGLGVYRDFTTATAEMVHPLAEAEPRAEQSALYDQIIGYFIQTRDALMQSPLPRQG
jgi:xylulokinase